MAMSQSTSGHLSAPPAVRRITGRDLGWALAEGWRDYTAKRGEMLFIVLLYPLVALGLAVVALNPRYLPMFFPLVAGLSIMGPAVAAGFYELARRREEGMESSWWHFLDPLRGRSRTPLAILTLMLVALFAAWQVAAWVIFSATIGTDPATNVMDFARQLFTTPEGQALMLIGNLVGFGFAVLTLTLTVVSFPMVVDKPVSAATAIGASIRAVAKNPFTMASWGLRVAVLLVLGCLPAFIGLAVVLPVLGYATWHLYTRLVER